MESCCIATTNTENRKVLYVCVGINDIYIFAFHFEFHKIFCLRKEKIFSTSDSIQSSTELITLFPLFEFCLTGNIVNRQVKLFLFRYGCKKII